MIDDGKSVAAKKDSTVDRKQFAESLGVTFSKQEPGYLAMVVRSGQQLITSGHVSDLKGKLGSGLTVEEGQMAARQCAAKILNSVWNFHGTLDGLRVLKVLGCVNSTLEFHGYHARSALGFAQLPTGAAVEVEAIFEILPS